MALIEQRADRYLRDPRLRLGDRGPELVAIAWSAPTPVSTSTPAIECAKHGEHGERVLTVQLDTLGEPVEEVLGPVCSEILALDRETHVPVNSSLAELEQRQGEAHVWVTHTQQRQPNQCSHGEVWLRMHGRQTLVFRANGSISAPTLVVTHHEDDSPSKSAENAKSTENGAWVAFHHDVREDTRQSDVSKWVALRFVDADGQVFEPCAPMVGRDRDQKEVEQSLEFPSLVVGQDGAVALFGRGSHNFWRQDLNHTGFSERMPLSDGEWGSRGRRVAALPLNDHSILVAMREREGIVTQKLDKVSGGSPKLKLLQAGDIDWTLLHTSENQEPSSAKSPVQQTQQTQQVYACPDDAWATHIYFGDIQQHSAHSDGIGSADEAYLRARDRYGDDFVALTDHESFIGKRTGPGEWAYLQDVANRYEEPGHFATLIAYEWTGRRYPGPGHKCVYFPETGFPLISRDDFPEGKDAVKQIRALGGIASPHHIGWTGCDEAGHDPVGQPVWEICSCHGCYEHADHPLGQRGDLTDQLVDTMLRRGHRFGFTASSDSHGLLWHHGESRKRDPYRTGLTAICVPELSRRSLFEGLRARHCYATSGAKIRVTIQVANTSMGQEIHVDGNGPVPVHVQAIGTTLIRNIELVTDQGVVACLPAEHNTTTTSRYASLSADTSGAWVYARVTQHDGEMAWTSPVFIDR